MNIPHFMMQKKVYVKNCSTKVKRGVEQMLMKADEGGRG